MIIVGDTIEVNFGRAAIKEEAEACEYGSYEDHIVHIKCERCIGAGSATFQNPATGEGRVVQCGMCKGAGYVTERLEPYDKGLLHIVELLQRDKRKTRVELHTAEEIEEFFGSLCTGTFGLYHLTVLRRIYKQLAPFVSAAVKERIPYHNLGY